MLSLVFLLGSYVFGLALQVVGVTAGARVAKSLRATWGRGVATGGLFTAVGVTVLVMQGASELWGALLVIVSLPWMFLIGKAMYRLSWGKAWWVFGGFFAAGALGQLVLLTLFQPLLVEAFAMASDSMAPTLGKQDYVIARKTRHVQRWDVVIHYDQKREVLAKRVVALPGETLSIVDGQIRINGTPIPAPPAVAGRYTIRPSDPAAATTARYTEGQEIRLAPDEYFLLGDNPEIALDSRFLGPFKSADLIGIVEWKYWPAWRAGRVR